MNCITTVKPKDLTSGTARPPARRMPALVPCPSLSHRARELDRQRGSRQAVGALARAPNPPFNPPVAGHSDRHSDRHSTRHSTRHVT